MKLKNTEAQPEDSVLGTINQHFHRDYQALIERQRQLIESGQYTVLVRMDDRLSVFRGTDETRFYVNTANYHGYKAASHIALATFLLLEHRRDGVAHFESLLRQLDPQGDQDVAQVVAASRQLMAEAGGQKLCYQAVKDFGKALAAPLARLLDRAARDEVHRIMAVLEGLDAEHAISWADTFLVVCDGAQPRYKNLSKMLFRRWIESRHDQLLDYQHHVLYSEACQTYEQVVDLLSRHLAGNVIGDVFLQNPLSLNQDVLGNAAQRAIDEYFSSGVQAHGLAAGREQEVREQEVREPEDTPVRPK